MRRNWTLATVALLVLTSGAWAQNSGSGGGAGSGSASGPAPGSGGTGISGGLGGTNSGISTGGQPGGAAGTGSLGSNPIAQPGAPTSTPGSGALPSQSLPSNAVQTPTGPNNVPRSAQGIRNDLNSANGNPLDPRGSSLGPRGALPNAVPQVILPEDRSRASAAGLGTPGSAADRAALYPNDRFDRQLQNDAVPRGTSNYGTRNNTDAYRADGFDRNPEQQREPQPIDAIGGAKQGGFAPYWKDPNIAWRYRWHGNQWWYYMPDTTWRIWNGSTWVTQEALYEAYSTGYRGLPPVKRNGMYLPEYRAYPQSGNAGAGTAARPAPRWTQ